MSFIHIKFSLIFHDSKGQIILKGLFGVLEFSQETNEQIRRSSKNEFVHSFFGRIRGYPKSFRNHLTFNQKFSPFSRRRETTWNLTPIKKPVFDPIQNM